ncbi:MAG: type I glyceraldehyde-3-phosphate dehydrogenase [Patescibacteria group bacterium]|nr:type I glyceraldehyde-3-phosphate dehydrogenase [Patescibacteria group bacterium]MDD5164228.1 type I glyceraldehyde-3-phosphate dehydrogenase [Patescibacteria group bacterium]MDD5534646.1 type I glyceraldehyde-3-phosphate dehydrogenase [Patescibacteria group bacterium]
MTDKKIKVAINGFGRIGRPSFRIASKSKNIEIVAINDLTDTKTLAHLLQYDSLYGKFEKEVSEDGKNLIVYPEQSRGVDGPSTGSGLVKKIPVFAEKDPALLPWKKLGVDVVLECTGFFTDYQGAKKHLEAGAKRVIISAPPKNSDIPTYVLGVNEEKFDSKKDLIISNGSCTTNCLAPMAKILNDNFKIKRGFMTTIHSYTNDQRLLDLPHKDLRRTRAAAENMIPTTTGATKSVAMVIPDLAGKLDGISLRVPTPVVSVVDFICSVEKQTSIAEVNNKFIAAAKGKLKGILNTSDELLVSSDFRGDSHSAIVDLPLTMVKDDLIKVMAWYDNEWGYSCRYVEMAEYVGKQISK